MLLPFTMALLTASGAENWAEGRVTAGEKHYTGLETAKHTSWELPRASTQTQHNREHYTVTARKCRAGTSHWQPLTRPSSPRCYWKAGLRVGGALGLKPRSSAVSLQSYVTSCKHRVLVLQL